MTPPCASEGYQLGPQWQISTLATPKGGLLRCGLYQPKEGVSPRKAVVFINGRGEFIEKYHYLADDLALPDDCCLLTWDHRGQGASSGLRAHIDHYDTFAEDARAVIAQLLPPTTPYTIVAHSMGALIALYGTLTGLLQPSHLIFSSPFLGFPPRPLPAPLAAIVAHLAVRFGLGAQPTQRRAREQLSLTATPLTSCPRRYARLLSSPYPSSSATFAWVKASLAALRCTLDSRLLANLTVPVSIFTATQESVVAKDGAKRWQARAQLCAPARVTHETIAGSRHELFSEAPAAYNLMLTKVHKILDPWLEAASQPKGAAPLNDKDQDWSLTPSG